MTFRQRVTEALKVKSAFDRDKKLRFVVNEFILKTGVNPRLFDGIFTRITKRKHTGVERRRGEH